MAFRDIRGDDNLKEAFAAIGATTVAWAALETILDSIIAIIYHKLGGKDIEKDLPISLKMKLTCLRKSAEKVNALDSRKDHLLHIVEQASSLKGKRHDAVHGYLSMVSEENDSLFVMRRLRIIDNLHTTTDAPLNLQNSPDLTQEILDLASEAVSLLSGLMAELHIERVPSPHIERHSAPSKQGN